MKLWRFYFWLSIAITAYAVWHVIVMPALMDIIGLTVSGFALVGLYGFCFNRKIGARNLWKVVFLTYLFEDVIYCLIRMHARSAYIGLSLLVIVYGMTFLLNLPSYIAMYLYAFKRNDIWGEKVSPK